MIQLPITSILAGALALLMTVLSVLVSMRRAATGTVYGDADDDVLRRRVRAHGNFSEYAAMAVILVALVELGGAANLLVRGLAAAFLASRLLHAYGMLHASSRALRGAAMVLQHGAALTAGIWLLARFLGEASG